MVIWEKRTFRTRSTLLRSPLCLVGHNLELRWVEGLYVDKPMKAHTLMQAIARANRVFPGKDFGLIVDYNGMLKSLRERSPSTRSATRSRATRRSSHPLRNAYRPS